MSVSLCHNSVVSLCGAGEVGVLVFVHLRAISECVSVCSFVSADCPVGVPQCPFSVYASVPGLSLSLGPCLRLGGGGERGGGGLGLQVPAAQAARGRTWGRRGRGGAWLRSDLDCGTSAAASATRLCRFPGPPSRAAPCAPPAFRLGPHRGASRRLGPAMSARSHHERR